MRNEFAYGLVDVRLTAVWEKHDKKIVFHILVSFAKILQHFKGLCEPNAYVTMTDTCYVNELRSFHFHRSRSLHSIDQSLCRRSHLNRRFGKISFRCLKSVIDTTTVVSSPQVHSFFLYGIHIAFLHL